MAARADRDGATVPTGDCVATEGSATSVSPPRPGWERGPGGGGTQFDTWLDAFFETYYRQNPVNATFIGVHEHDHRLPDVSEAGTDAARSEIARLRRELAALPEEPLSLAQSIDRELAAGFLAIRAWELESPHFRYANPSVYTGEAIFGVMALFLRRFGTVPERVEAAIERMEAIPAFLGQGRGATRGAPEPWIERARRECAGALAFLERGIALLADEYRDYRPELQRVARKAATAFAEVDRYLAAELPRMPDDIVACGPETFDLILRRAHFVEWDAETIAAYAAEEMDRSEAELVAGTREFGSGTWRETLDGLRRHHARTSAAYYARYDELWSASRALAQQMQLITWPDYPIRYVPQPLWAREAAPNLYFLFYRSPAPFDPLTGPVEYLVTPIEPDLPAAERDALLEATNDSVIKLNHVVHHGGIGHHIQNWHAFRAESRIGRIAAVDCASRIAMLCGGTMAEGWACYATGLMGEAGFLTPLERYSEHHARLRMAARAFVDCEMHTGRLSLDEATALYRNRIGMPPAAARAEAVKNSMFPGGAVMYLLGTDAIKDLRRRVAEREGTDFDLKRFHDRFLSFGSIPVSLIARQMAEG
ncbi:MAG TPA: DUF885 domain-containing protein [Chloroflexota bacterium]|nr:DUF885 domain-containing protein [Chloroflexota bacterium]